MKLVYLDNAATTKMSKRVIEEMTESFENIYGNPSSTHTLGQKAKAVVENARHIVAKNLKVEAKEIVFTSGGAEGNNLVIKGFLKQNKDKGKHIITTKIEHSTVLKTFESLEKQGYDVTYIDVTKDGIIDVEKLKKAVRQDTVLVSVMFVNNETGVIQPIKEIGEILAERNIFFHTDAVQVIGKLEILPKNLKIGALTATAHKFYGPKGAGFVFIDKKYSLEKEIWGGSQERNRRAGTENVHGILGLGVALEEVYENLKEIEEKEGKLQPGGTIVEPTSGNTGIALALIGKAKGYKVVIVMPDSMSVERRSILAAYGAELILTEGAKGMKGAIAEAEKLAAENGYFLPQQFENPANPAKHYETTAKEILDDFPQIDAFVSGVGTAGTLSGVGKRLKEERPGVKVFAVEPATSAVLSGEQPGKHFQQGLGAGFVPGNYDASLVDEIIKVTNEQAVEFATRASKENGLFIGISSGSAIAAAYEVAKKLGKGKKVVAILPDGGEKYLSIEAFRNSL